MLQATSKRCHHSKAIPIECCSFCTSSTPNKLLDICFDYIIKHFETIRDRHTLTLIEHITLPVEICERLIERASRHQPSQIDNDLVKLFENQQQTRLKRVKLRNTSINDSSLKTLLKHRLHELELVNNPLLTNDVINLINYYGDNLQTLTFGENLNVFYDNIFEILKLPHLRKLTIRNLFDFRTDFYKILLSPLTTLTHLDLSNCSHLGTLQYVENLINLQTLILYNVTNVEKTIPTICKLKNLQHLDLSQSRDDDGKFANPNCMLTKLVTSLGKLQSLDISGTNLAGNGVAKLDEECKNGLRTDIPGLALRVNNPLNFLGLYETHHDACLRHDIPAKLIAGNANEEQILIAALVYLDRADMLQKVLNELFHLFRFESCEHVGQALYIVLESMNRHLSEKHIQISGSATLFYIVKSTEKELRDVVEVKRKIITTLLNGMCTFRDDDTMMRNGCLTLCQFKIPSDVVFDYERLVDILLHSVYGMHQETFVQRIGIYLLNSLACQVDGQQKIKLGELGAISKMLFLIIHRLRRGICDDVLEVAWSTMWNVTDETPANCKRFLENRGMDLFLECLEKFPDKEELLRNMMGLLGNVAEVRDLRHHLMRPEYITVFANLLDSVSDGIEVSYNAAGVISHIASDGPAAWTIKEPTRELVLARMVCAIECWDLSSQRNINYRSFEPILDLVAITHTPACQLWAVWALANLTRVYPEKYCDLVIEEGGLNLLKLLLEHPYTPPQIKELSTIVIENCKNYKEPCCLLDG